MPMEFEYVSGDSITVPYGPIFDDVRRNRGFVDTRRRPDLAATVAEGNGSAGLRALLIDIASRDRYFSLGCDLGEHQEPESPRSKRFVAGGYVHLAGFRYELQETEIYDQFCGELEIELKRAYPKEVNWRIKCKGGWVAFRLPDEEQDTKPSMWVWFFAADQTPQRATESRERLLEVLLLALNQESVYGQFRVRAPESN